LGEWNQATNPDCDNFDEDVSKHKCATERVQDIEIEDYIVHEQYDVPRKSKKNDIALIRLKTPATYNTMVAPVCLPLSKELQEKNLTSHILWAVGWGVTEHKVPSQIKLKVDLPVVDIKKCTSLYGMKLVWENQICAGGELGKDSCQGDSGGPLMKNVAGEHNDFWYIAGVVSYGKKCGLADTQAIYTNVGKYMDWIFENVKP
jgi:secreted trypsin-like serine protease